jgi:hypothetical protein
MRVETLLGFGIALGSASASSHLALAFVKGHTLERWGMVALCVLVISTNFARLLELRRRGADDVMLSTEEFSALVGKLRELNDAGYTPSAEHLASALRWPLSRARGAMRLLYRCGLLFSKPG